ncbi:MAG: flagellar hook protein FlgE [Candidatus Accumulibacter sp.]|jgi:flagellar hook protein FlgE|nr:flagellar hook protein FlgE [Accumulibacter sp.]
MAFQQGLSGLNASSKALDVIGNNVANASTVGFKLSSAHFADVYAATLNGTGATQVGIGTMISSVFQQFTQGNITTTNNPLDVAINGGGFFNVTRDGLTYYTRNGQFHTDLEGYVINDEGCRLMGYPATTTGEIVPALPQPIRADTANIAPRPTGSAEGGDARMVLNLDSSMDVPTATPFNPQNPLSYSYSTAMTVYDTLGVEHIVTYFFVKTTASSPATWELKATLDGDPGSVEPMASLEFDTNGRLTTTPMPMTLPGNWAITTGASTPLGSGGLPNWNIDFTGTTNYAGASTENSQYQGGYAQGALSSISFGSDGVVLGNYSNGRSKPLAQIVLSTFPNMNGLLNIGNNLFEATSASGQGLIGAPGAGTRGMLRPMAVEESNTDLTTELVNMITQQRNYQANAQTIKTQDSIMQTLVSMR